MNEISYFLSNLLNNHAERLVIGFIAFLPFALYWRETGRLFFIGWIVRILWIPINIAFIFIWLLSIILRVIVDIIRSNNLLKFIVIVGLAWLIYVSIFFTPLSAYVFYIVWYGVDTEGVRKYIFYYPKAKRFNLPKIKVPKPPKSPKVAKSEKKGKEKETEKPPLVVISAKTSGSFESEEGLISQLPPHLQALINK